MSRNHVIDQFLDPQTGIMGKGNYIMNMHDYIGLCRIIYDYVCLYITMYDYVWLCVIMYDVKWPCMTLFDYV